MKIALSMTVAVLAVSFGVKQDQNVTFDSYRRAKEVVDRSVAAYGLEQLKAIENISIRVEGDSVHRNQSRRPGAFDRTPYSGEVIIDLKTNRLKQTQKGHYPGGFDWHQGVVIDGANRTSFDLIRNTSNQPGTITPAVFKQTIRWLPQFVILNVLERAESLRYLGKAGFENRTHDVVDYVSNDGGRLALYIDERSGLLSKFEVFFTDRFSGDSVLETRFPGQRTLGNFIVPTGRVNVVNGDITNEFRFADVAINTQLRPEAFRVPEGLRPVTFPAPAPVTKHADKVYTTNAGGYNVLFVDFRDYIFVMEAPGNDRVSLQAIDQIKKTIPGKPIRYVAVTHHHDDHAGGIRTYIAEGATLIIAPGEQEFFRKVSASRFTAEPDTLTRRPREPKFEPLQNGKRVLTDGATTVELLDIGPSPHTQQMLVAHLPNEKIIFQGDLLNRPPNGDNPIANDTTVHFAKWIESKNLAVDRIVAVHGPVSTIDELRKAVADKLNAGK